MRGSRTWAAVRWVGRRRRFLLGGVLAWVAAVWMWSALRDRVGHPNLETADRWHEGHRIVDRQGRLLRELPTDHGRRGRPLTLAEMGERIVTATVVSEDADFVDHDGIDRVAILRAAVDNATHGRIVSGASTITQQLVKLLDNRGIDSRRTLGIKIEEAARAQNLEQTLDKRQILVEYMNRLPYGHGLIGPEAAAQGYFGVPAASLSWAQSAFLAVLPRAPSALDPYEHRERAIARQRLVLQALAEREILDEAALARALAEPIEPRALTHAFAAPHFVQTLLSESRTSAGAITTTTLDLALQRDVEGLLSGHVASLGAYSATNAAAIVLDNESGDILAWVGSADFFDAERAGQVDMVRARRQPGSTLKPFVYALAFADGLTGASMLADVPTVFDEGHGHSYVPQNFHRGTLGPIAAREALAASLNIPAVRLLAQQGTDALLSLSHRMGLRSLDEDAEHYGLALALGSGEVTLRELAGAYATLARGGTFRPLRYTTDTPAAPPAPVLDPEVAATVTEALSDPLSRARLVPGASPFSIGMPVAVKTGTSSGFRDAWTAGYTRERTVVVWVGNADSKPMDNVTGAHGAGGLFADIMRRSMRDVGTVAPLVEPGMLQSAMVCPLTGLRPSSACPHAVPRRFAAGHVPTQSCTAHVHATRVGDDHWRCTPDGEATIVALPEQYDTWLHGLPPAAPGRDPDGLPWLPAADVPGCAASAEGPATLQIVEPAHGTVVYGGRAGDRVEIVASLRGRASLHGAVELVVDGQVVATVREGDPAEGTTRRTYTALVPLAIGDHEVWARPADARVTIATGPASFAVR